MALTTKKTPQLEVKQELGRKELMKKRQLTVRLRLKFCEFRAGVETGTVLGYVGEFAMAYDTGLGVVAMQLLQ